MNRGEMTYSGSRPPSAGGTDGYGGDGGGGFSRNETGEQAEIARPAVGQGLERAVVFFGDVGGHGGDPRLDDALHGSGAVASLGHTGLDRPEPAAAPGGGIRCGGNGGCGGGSTAITGQIEFGVAPVRPSESVELRHTCGPCGLRDGRPAGVASDWRVLAALGKTGLGVAGEYQKPGGQVTVGGLDCLM